MSKQFKKFGVASKEYGNYITARDDTYTTKEGVAIPTNLFIDDNPFVNDIKKAKYVFEIGFGVGRNFSWFMKNTKAIYVGIEPNETMFKYFWEHNDRKYEKRAMLFSDFSQIPNDIKFDLVLSTFVFQHIAFMPPDDTMNVSDISSEIRKFTNKGTVWFLYEHDGEQDGWIERWMREQDIVPDVYLRHYEGIEGLTDRDHLVGNGQGNHLVIWKQK